MIPKDMRVGDVVTNDMLGESCRLFLLVRLEPLDGLDLAATWLNLLTGEVSTFSYSWYQDLMWSCVVRGGKP